MKILIVLFIIAAGYDFFYLIPNKELTKAASDAGLMVLFFYLFYQLILQRTDFRRLNSFITWYIFYYLLLVLIQASIASFMYQQSVFDGLVVARNQFHYLLALSLAIDFRDDADIDNLMKAISLMAVGIFYLALINYFGPTIFQHRWGEGQGIRSGVVRAYVPGMEIFPLVAIWQMNKFLNAERFKKSCVAILLIVFAALLFRQTKMHIIAATAGCSLLLMYHRRFGVLLIGVGALIVTGLVTEIRTGNNLVLGAFTTAFENIATPDEEERSTWDARMEQVEEAINVVESTFLTGSGGIVIREVEQGSLDSKLHNIRRGMDLGYFVWIKFYGLPGIILMLALYFYMFRSWFVTKNSEYIRRKDTSDFAFFHSIAIIISMLTIGYFTIPGPIHVMCVTLAILLHKNRELKEAKFISGQK